MYFLLTEIYIALIGFSCLIVYSLKGQELHLVIMLLFTIIIFFLIWDGNFEISNNVYILNFNLKLNSMIIFIKLLVILFLFNYIYLSKNFFTFEKLYIKEFLLIILLLVISVFFLIMSNEFFLLYLALELQNLILYILACLRRHRSLSIEAGIKYYIMGSFSSGLLLYGIVMIFSYLGTLDFIEIAYLLKDIYFININLDYLVFFFLFIFFGLLFKLGVAPLHWWVPEIYEGAPVVITLLFTILPKISLIVVILNLYVYIIYYLEFFFNSLFFFFCIISLIFGFIFSLYQKKIIKFLAYSSIFNSAFFLACFSNGTFFSFISLLYFFLPYIFVLLGIFFIIISYRKLNYEKLNLLWDFSILGNSNYFLGFIISVLFFSLAGIPPLSGFFSKFFILLSLILNEYYLLFFILIFFSVISSFYYFRVIRFVFFSNILEYTFLKSYLNTIFLIFYFVFSLFFFVFFDYFFLYLLNLNFFFYG